MERNLRIVWTSSLLIIAMIVTLGIVFKEVFLRIDWVIGIFIGVAMTSFIVYIGFVTGKNPPTFPLAIVGYSGSGKTVYLSVLFHILAQNRTSFIRFRPGDVDTIERVSENMSLLLGGKWLSKTEPGTTFYFRGNITLGTELMGLLRRSYKLEVADYAGEHIEELIPYSKRWTHKSDYFNIVVKSYGILWAIDTNFLLNGKKDEVEEMQNDFIAAIQVLANEKGGTEINKVSTPLALLFLKIDVIQDRAKASELVSQINKVEAEIVMLKSKLIELTDSSTEDDRRQDRETKDHIDQLLKKSNIIKDEYKELKQKEEEYFESASKKIEYLTTICRERFANFEVFRVSSVGYVHPGGEPPNELEPQGIIEPLTWLVPKIK
jgi:ABC-type dipeptide/oligopeptide/nickel transport system ATPase component